MGITTPGIGDVGMQGELENHDYQASFPGTDYPPLLIKAHQNLSEVLTVQNSPVLFGCRTGICGTCLVLVQGELPPPNQSEQELLEILAPDHPQARLACQLEITSDIAIRKLSHP